MSNVSHDADLPDDAAPLAGLRVLDIATFIAAPFAAAILGEFGAEVIKVETPAGGDTFRKFGTPTERDDSSLMWLSEARNKRSVTLNLKTPEGVALLKQLVRQSDVLCENFRPGTLEKWGLGWDVLSEINPALILLRVSGYGQTGPYRERPGFARIAHAFGGLTALAGNEGETPVTPGSTSLGDYMSGMYGAIGILTALRERDRSGLGQVVDIALYEPVFRVLDEVAPAYARNGVVRGPEGSGTRNACPHGHFPTADDGWVAIACTTDKMFHRIAGAMGRPELADEDQFGPLRRRLANRDTIDRLVAAWTGSMMRDDVMAVCLDHAVPCAPVNTIADLFDDPQIEARDNLLTLRHPELGEITVPGVVPRLSRTAGSVRHLGPPLGNATREVLGALCGLGDDELDDLRQKGVIAEDPA